MTRTTRADVRSDARIRTRSFEQGPPRLSRCALRTWQTAQTAQTAQRVARSIELRLIDRGSHSVVKLATHAVSSVLEGPIDGRGESARCKRCSSAAKQSSTTAPGVDCWGCTAVSPLLRNCQSAAVGCSILVSLVSHLPPGCWSGAGPVLARPRCARQLARTA